MAADQARALTWKPSSCLDHSCAQGRRSRISRSRHDVPRHWYSLFENGASWGSRRKKMYTLGANTTNHVQAIVEDVFPPFQKLISALTFPEGVCIGNKCHKRRGRSKQFLNEAVRI